MIAQRGAGQVWYAEADSPVGPWVYARKIVSHDRYNFYNPAQHPFFDQEQGRIIYFEGTFTDSFSSAPVPTPRYNYNQLLYRLRLEDPRLFLPVPVYRLRTSTGQVQYRLREGIAAENLWEDVVEAPFFGMPPDRHLEGQIPIYALRAKEGVILSRAPGVAPQDKPASALFFALSAPQSGTIPLYEHIGPAGSRVYSSEKTLRDAAWRQVGEPLCWVWRNPMSLLILDRQAEGRASSPLTYP
jgi:hypothetical protein